MRLTTMTDYAVRLLLFVAQHPERLCTIAEIARNYGVSETHLMKVTHLLGQRGWIETVRGKGGGMRLAHAPGEINVGRLIRDIEPDFDLVECFGPADRCTLTGNCRLSDALHGALHSFLSYLDKVSLADLLSCPSHPVPDERPVRFKPRQSI